MADLLHVNDDTFDAEVVDSQLPVLVDFWADWCGPCKMVEPHLKALAEEIPDRVRVVKLNLDENPATSMRYGVMSIPTMILFIDGEEKVRLVGARPKAAIMAEIGDYLTTRIPESQPTQQAAG